MRKIAFVLLGCLALSGCASTWEEETRFKITKIENDEFAIDPKYAKQITMELVGEVPDGVLNERSIKLQVVRSGVISGDVAVGDEVICTAKQETIGAFQANSIETDVSGCRKA